MIAFIGCAFAQALFGGGVTLAIATRNYPAAFVAGFLLNLLWWFNIGQRIDYQGAPIMGVYYALSVAAGTTLGAGILAVYENRRAR